MDILSDVIASLRLRGGLYFLTDFTGGWAVGIPSDAKAVRVHLVVQGHCWVAVGGESATLLREGDFVLVPHGAAQTLASDTDLTPISLSSLMGPGNPGDDGVLRYAGPGDGGRSRLVCGLCRFDERLSHPVMLGLPPCIVLGARSIGDSPWLLEAVRVTTMEANLGDVGMREIMSRLIEVLFIQAIRHQLRATAEATHNAFLAAMSDKHLSSALRAMHEQIDRDWTIGGLARLSGMSRTQFARRFRAVMKQTPMQYLTDWRLQKARQWLRETDASVEAIGLRSGYRSQPSFTRRFKERFGVTPLAYRRAAPSAGRGTGTG